MLCLPVLNYSMLFMKKNMKTSCLTMMETLTGIQKHMNHMVNGVLILGKILIFVQNYLFPKHKQILNILFAIRSVLMICQNIILHKNIWR